MKQYPAGHFLSGRSYEADLSRRLNDQFRPHERAQVDAQRVDDDPVALASAYVADIEHSRSQERADVRTRTFAAIEANADAIGALVVSVSPDDVKHLVAETETALSSLEVEHRKAAAAVKDAWRRALAAFTAWVHGSGAKHRSRPWPQPPAFVLSVSAAALVETWLGAQVLAGPPIVGVPPPILLGLIFAMGSVVAGFLLGLGHMLAAHKQPAPRATGIGVLVIAIACWAALAVLGAHMRAVIADGGTGTVDELVVSLRHGLLRPLLSPLALLLAAGSAVTTAVMWLETVRFWGVPLGYRSKAAERQWAADRLHEAEEAQKTRVKSLIAGAGARLESFLSSAWKPVNDGVRFERELALVLTPAREHERAVDRAHGALLKDYGATFRHIRPGVDLRPILALRLEPPEDLGEPHSLHDRVGALERAATTVDEAVRAAKLRLRRLQVEQLAQIDALYADTRPKAAEAAARSPVLLEQSR
jgi:hypothetical protein